MRFDKWQAAGNDFVLVDADEARAAWGGDWLATERPQRLCDRRRGIGADGVLVLGGLTSGSPSMIIINADGSRAEMCGNGLRCAAGYLAELGRIDGGAVVIDTDVGPLECEVARISERSYRVGAAMGTARVGSATSFPWPDGPVELDWVDVGNPHAVLFADDDSVLDALGPAVDQSRPDGSNVEICRVEDEGRRLRVWVYERGVGRTLACGTGACAVAAAAVARGVTSAFGTVTVAMPGGDLEIAVKPTALEGAFAVRLTGPAVRVFQGELVD
ncbi:MAG: diaminopimelate epimerase [Deltaproteobacteria bacterium]|jgi:diaminopimelate epimerase|nr:diaminopimelate epimerase [Deltaproteobacteria bacterium]MBW2530095.1 diaminopimelate epimerase [Deltaproteobacteria bacterium]